MLRSVENQKVGGVVGLTVLNPKRIVPSIFVVGYPMTPGMTLRDLIKIIKSAPSRLLEVRLSSIAHIAVVICFLALTGLVGVWLNVPNGALFVVPLIILLHYLEERRKERKLKRNLEGQ